MLEPMQKATDDFQKMSKDNYDAVLRSYGELNKGLQAIAARVTDYSKTAFEDATRAFEQMVGAKSLERVIEIQSQYANMTLGLPRHRSSVRCMPPSPAMPTSRWRKL